jgi:hypothetical protein
MKIGSSKYSGEQMNFYNTSMGVDTYEIKGC